MPNYRRAWVRGGCYFFTVALADRSSCLLVDRINVLRNSLREAKGLRPFRINAIVVLPDHLHCIWTLPPGDADFATRWAHVKTAFSRRLPAHSCRRDSLVAKRERGIWQRRFWEHLIRNDRDLRSHVDYIHFNPVKHGLVARASAWRWSSLHEYIRTGWVSADWATGVFDPDANFNKSLEEPR